MLLLSLLPSPPFLFCCTNLNNNLQRLQCSLIMRLLNHAIDIAKENIMLTTQWTKPLTVEMLLDIIDSQLVCFGNHQLVTKPELSNCVALFANGKSVMRCMDNNSMRADKGDLAQLQTRLKKLSAKSQKSIIQTSDKVSMPFQVGFNHSVEGFIEVIATNEVAIARK